MTETPTEDLTQNSAKMLRRAQKQEVTQILEVASPEFRTAEEVAREVGFGVALSHLILKEVADEHRQPQARSKGESDRFRVTGSADHDSFAVDSREVALND